MRSFGQQLRFLRRQAVDPLRGGMLTQERLGELLGDALGDGGYSGAAVSDWERDKSRIGADNRMVLLSLITVLHQCGAIPGPEEVDELLRCGQYRALNRQEQEQIFPALAAAPAAAAATVPAPAGEMQPTSPNRDRQLLLDKVDQFWVQGVLEKATGGIRLNLHQEQIDNLIEHPWQDVLNLAVFQPEQAAGSLMEVFESSDRALLILGAPGAGKTITLLVLAQELIQLARRDIGQPMPIILNLVSWAEKQANLDRWIVQELTAKYQIPRQLGRQWLNEKQLTLLLDGFDEVAAASRQSCARAINHFRQEYGLSGMVVCSRPVEYEAAGERLKLNDAILLRPLDEAQINAYLEAAGVNRGFLQTAIHRDPLLQKMARRPLTLSVLVAAFAQPDGEQPAGLPTDLAVPPGDQGVQLFATYVEQMFRRRPPHPTYSQAQIRRRLGWLARQMFTHNQTLFLIEQLQPSWLAGRPWRWLYLLTSRLVDGLFAGLVLWLIFLMAQQNAPGLLAFTGRLAEELPISVAMADFLTVLFLNGALGLAAAVMDGLFYEQTGEKNGPAPGRLGRHRLRSALAIGLLASLALALFYHNLPLALFGGIVEALTFALTAHFVHGDSFDTDIRTVEALSWSWSGALKTLPAGLALAALAEFIEWQLFGYNGVIRSLFGYGVPLMLAGGLSGSAVEAKTRPNQSMWLSGRNALLAASLFGLVLTLLFSLLWSPDLGIIVGLSAAIIAGGFYGGGNIIYHYYVRAILWSRGQTPWPLVDFLDHAAALVFLRKVGGGYIFVHRALQDYFATEEAEGDRRQ